MPSTQHVINPSSRQADMNSPPQTCYPSSISSYSFVPFMRVRQRLLSIRRFARRHAARPGGRRLEREATRFLRFVSPDLIPHVVITQDEQWRIPPGVSRFCAQTRRDLCARVNMPHYRGRRTRQRAWERVLAERAQRSIRGRLRARIRLLLDDAYTHGYAAVWQTLTVAPQHYETVFTRGSRAWNTYVRSLRAIGLRDYVCVVESGSRAGRLHLHCVLVFDRIHPTWTDPNRRLRTPYRREITALRGIWRYGYESPVALRLGPDDCYALAGWYWPIKNGRPIDDSSIAVYISKYVTKSLSDRRPGCQFRTRMSRLCGLKPLLATMSSWTHRQLALAVVAPKRVFPEVPGGLVRHVALRCSWRAGWLPTPLLRELNLGAPYTGPMRYLRMTKPGLSSRSITSWIQALTARLAGCDDYVLPTGLVDLTGAVAASLVAERPSRVGYPSYELA